MPEAFCYYLWENNVNQLVKEETTLLEANRVLHRELLHTASVMAPLKTVKVRKEHVPGLSENTKMLLARKNFLLRKLRRDR